MTDSEKIGLIDLMLTDFWQCSNISEDSTVCMLNTIASVINFGKENNNNEN